MNGSLEHRVTVGGAPTQPPVGVERADFKLHVGTGAPIRHPFRMTPSSRPLWEGRKPTPNQRDERAFRVLTWYIASRRVTSPFALAFA